MGDDGYDVGDTMSLTARFRDSAGARQTPQTVTLAIEKPDGTVATITDGFVGFDGGPRVRRGEFRYDVALDQGGVWRWRWTGTGGIAAAEQDRVYVRPARP